MESSVNSLDINSKHIVMQLLDSMTKLLDNSIQKLNLDDDKKRKLSETLIDSISKRFKARVNIDGIPWDEHPSSEESIDQVWANLLQQYLSYEKIEEANVADRQSRHQRVAILLHDLFQLRRANMEKYERIELIAKIVQPDDSSKEPIFDVEEFVELPQRLEILHQRLTDAKQKLKILREREEALK
ncbi:hypothetical protein TrispH2_007211 [Trichoplax sp. H2]|nr:hypothetical protein TrispH2_007211 [Trichoplax sp. H2]|eukprot:RDD40290.1 hypothetical protein TrispH2_007211 [Trichoplax sp. H2]